MVKAVFCASGRVEMACWSLISVSSPSKYWSALSVFSIAISPSFESCSLRLRMKSRASFMHIRHSHVDTAASPLNSSSLTHAFRNAFCSTSSASSWRTTIWRMRQYITWEYWFTIASNALRRVAWSRSCDISSLSVNFLYRYLFNAFSNRGS